MINILIITHGSFAKEILSSAELVVGKQSNVLTIGLYHGDNIDEYSEKVAKSIGELGKRDGVLIFVDLYGGSPSNTVALSMNSQDTKQAKFECITGFNFPMLLEALTMRDDMELNELKEHCIEMGRSGIKDVRRELNVLS